MDLLLMGHRDSAFLLTPRSHFPWKHDGATIIPPLPSGTILLVDVGSTAHGTGLPGGEDQDETAIVVESPEQVLGLDPRGPATIMQRTQPEGVKSGPGDIDRTLHPLRRFLCLAASGNPSVLMSLWTPVLEATPEGLELQVLGDLFVGRHVIPRHRRVHGITGDTTAGYWWNPTRQKGRSPPRAPECGRRL